MYRSGQTISDSDQSSNGDHDPEPISPTLHSVDSDRSRSSSVIKAGVHELPVENHERVKDKRHRSVSAKQSGSTSDGSHQQVIRTPPSSERRLPTRIHRKGQSAAPKQDSSLVIALDFGTTFTGVAYAKVQGSQLNLDEINIVRNWNQRMTNRDKIDSLKSYTRIEDDEDNFEQWGSDLSRHAVAMTNMKLELQQGDRSEELDMLLCLLEGTDDLDFEGIRETDGDPDYTWRSPQVIITDFLTHVVDNLDSILAQDMYELRHTWPMDVVITVPVQWSYEASNSTVHAVQEAGLSKRNYRNLRSIKLVSEPEAAALYTARYCLRDEDGYKGLGVGQCFVLCDAGGGTVDLVSYRVRQISPTFEMECISKPTSAQCGSSYINLAFKYWLYEQLGEENYNLLSESSAGGRINMSSAEGSRMRSILTAFETYKRLFTRDSQAPFKLDLPAPLQDRTIGEHIRDGELTIPSKVMRSFFDPRINRIVGLLKGQVAQIERRKYRLKTIFLVGGFGESIYLRQMLTHSFGRHFRQGAQVKVPDTSWTAVVRGAVLHGVPSAKNGASKIIRQSSAFYGVLFDEPYRPGRYNNSDVFTSTMTNMRMVRSQYRWIIASGDILPEVVHQEKHLTKEVEFMITFEAESSKRRSLSMYAYIGDDEPPDREIADGEEALRRIGQLDFDLASVPMEFFDVYTNKDGQRPYYVARLILSMSISGQDLVTEIKFETRLLASLTLENIEPR